MSKRVPLSRNLLTYIGWLIALVSFAIGVVLIIADMFFSTSSYNALVTYMVIPSAISFGVGLAVLGIILEWRNRKKTGVTHALPIFDMNNPTSRRNLLVTIVVLSVFFGVSSVATYRAFVWTESVEFCGQVCHQIMTPEYVAYKESPHARVKCVECHIGEGAEWYARAKISGLRQVYRTVLNSYELPIEVPIRNLRPARETCENCHWPEKFTGVIERVQWHFWRDEENTPSKYNILMKVGGANRETGESSGIHWHTSSQDTVRYWPEPPKKPADLDESTLEGRDRLKYVNQRQDIPWVEVTYADGSKKVFRRDGYKDDPPEEEIRTMDCIDCHNRPAHVYKRPEVLLNAALASGTLDRKLPSIKANGIDWLSDDYETQAAASQAIHKSIQDAYADGVGDDYTEKDVEQASDQLVDMYNMSHFPVQKVDWSIYPNNIGHRTFPGCFRCHSGDHETEDGEVISNDCSLCHEIVFQAHGKDALGAVTYKSQDFQHPGEDMEDIWEGSLCTDCHAPGAM